MGAPPLEAFKILVWGQREPELQHNTLALVAAQDVNK